MLRRNAAAIVWWDANQQHLGSESEYPVLQTKFFKPPPHGVTSLHPLRLDNGILDLALLNFSNHNVLIMQAGAYFPYAVKLRAMICKGKLKFITFGSRDTKPSVIFPNVATGILSVNKDNIGYIFPYFKEIIGLYDMAGNLIEGEEDEITLAARSRYFEVTGKKYSEAFYQAMHLTRDLNKLQLACPSETHTGDHILFAIKENGEIQVLLDPSELYFNNYNPLEDPSNLQYVFNHILSEQAETKELHLPSFTISLNTEVVNYDIPEWKSKTIEENVSNMLNSIADFILEGLQSNLTYNELRIIRQYNKEIDKIMCLICFGHGLELFNKLTKAYEGEQLLYHEGSIGTLINIANAMLLEYYREIPYERLSSNKMPYSDQQTVWNDDKEISSLNRNLLTDPNLYRKTYHDIRTKNNTLISHPTNPPEDVFHTLAEIFDVKEGNTEQSILKIDEYNLIVESIVGPVIRINGIEFKSADLIVFYNTQFYDIVSLLSASTNIIKISHIRLSDLKLVKDLLEGRIMVQTFRDSLSSSGVVFFGGDRTFYQLSYVTLSLLYFNAIFSFGKKFINQLKEGEEFYEVIPVIPRWEEFLRITGVARFSIM